MPLVLDIDEEITCEIDDGSGTSCQDFINTVTSINKCNVDIAFKFTFTNRGLACVHVSDILVSLGPIGDELLSFDDIYSYQERELCVGETWTVPDRRRKVKLCKESDTAWDIFIEVKESRGQQKRRRYTFGWIPYLGSSAVPYPSPTAVPTIDTCQDCTLTGLVSASKYHCIFSFSIIFIGKHQSYRVLSVTLSLLYCSCEIYIH